MPTDPYRGDFGPTGRAPRPGCITESEARYRFPQRCGVADPITGAGWYCTRRHGHRGDHVARLFSSERVRVRWEPRPGERGEHG